MPRKRPATAVLPPRSRIRKGAVGSSWKSDRKTVNVKPHIMKKRGVNSGGGPAADGGSLDDGWEATLPAHPAGASPRRGSQARSSGPFSVQTAKRSACCPSRAYIETPAYSPFLLTA